MKRRPLVVESLAVGDELLDGRLADTNSQLLADALFRLGLSLSRIAAVGDDKDAIAEAVREAAARADVVVTSGGLGPTSDDLTAEGVALAAGVGLRLDEEAWQRIQRRFEERGFPLPPNNRRQAEVPETAEVLANEVGVAPAFVTRVGGAEVWSLPGVPHEYRDFLERCLSPALGERLQGQRPLYVAHRTLRCLGITESALGHALADLERAHLDVRVQYRTRFFENLARLLVEGDDRDEVERRADALAAEARASIGGAVYAIGEEPLEAVLLGALKERGLTLATAESCTGGLIGKLLTDTPGSSAVYLGGVIAYANGAKTAFLDVPEALLEERGAVSEEVAAAMAEGARRRFGASFAVSVTGIAGPGGGSEEKPVGTVCFGLAGPGGTRTKRRLLAFPTRDQIRKLAAAVALRYVLNEVERASPGERG